MQYISKREHVEGIIFHYMHFYFSLGAPNKQTKLYTFRNRKCNYKGDIGNTIYKQERAHRGHLILLLTFLI